MWKTSNFEWGMEKIKALESVQAIVPAALLLGSFDQVDPIVLEE